jgi:hypothetical protein
MPLSRLWTAAPADVDGRGWEVGRSERRNFSDLAGVFGIDEMFASLLTCMKLTLHTAKQRWALRDRNRIEFLAMVMFVIARSTERGLKESLRIRR